MLLNEYIIFFTFFNFWQYFVENINWQFPRWHPLTRHRAPSLFISILCTFTAFSHQFLHTHTLYVTVLNWLFVQNILKLVKIIRAKQRLDLWHQTFLQYLTKHLKHLSSKINLSFGTWTLLEIRYHPTELDSGKYCDCIIF